MNRYLPAFFLLLSCFFALASCKKEKKEHVFAQNTIVYDTSLPSNQAMAKYLKDCNEQYFKNTHNRFASSTMANDIASRPAPSDAKKFAEWKKAVGDQWLFAGETQKAIDNYDEASAKIEAEKIKGDIGSEVLFMRAWLICDSVSRRTA